MSSSEAFNSQTYFPPLGTFNFKIAYHKVRQKQPLWFASRNSSTVASRKAPSRARRASDFHTLECTSHREA